MTGCGSGCACESGREAGVVAGADVAGRHADQAERKAAPQCINDDPYALSGGVACRR